MLNSVKMEEYFRIMLYFYLMKNRLVNIITILIIAALCGLIALQVYFLKNAYEQENQIFNNNVISVLNELSRSLDEEEAATGIMDLVYDVRSVAADESGKVMKTVVMKAKGKPDTPTVFRVRKGFEGDIVNSESVIVSKDTFENSKIFFHKDNNSDTLLPGTLAYTFKSDSNHFAFSYRFDDIIDTLKRLDSTRKNIIVSNVVTKMMLSDSIAIQKRLPKEKLDSLLNIRLSGLGIDIPYKYSVYSGFRDSLKFIYGSDSLYTYKHINTKAELFSSDILPFRNILVVDFPSKAVFIYKQIMTQTILSVIFLSLIAFGFIYTIRTIHRQKKIAANVVNFINNMTHEFKTPISTIAIASDAIGKPEVLEDRSKICRYNTVIKEENTRMRQQVEKILEMAVIEEGEFELKREKLNVHDIIERAAESMYVRIENAHGKINYDFQAVNYLITGDQIHIMNILYNIFDNAIKYSNQPPVISISTRSNGESLHILISDNGIGIKAQDIKKVFDKYYRVPTGNLHNVKGFGLGLSYVKLMVEAHQGRIDINSEYGKGTQIELIFPAAHE